LLQDAHIALHAQSKKFRIRLKIGTRPSKKVREQSLGRQSEGKQTAHGRRSLNSSSLQHQEDLATKKLEKNGPPTRGHLLCRSEKKEEPRRETSWSRGHNLSGGGKGKEASAGTHSSARQGHYQSEKNSFSWGPEDGRGVPPRPKVLFCLRSGIKEGRFQLSK